MSRVDSALSGLQTYGRFATYLKTAGIVGGAAILMSIAVGVARHAMNDPHDKSTIANVNNVRCTDRVVTTTDKKGNRSSHTYYDCIGDATYSVGASTFTKNLHFENLTRPYSNGDNATVYYNPANAADVIASAPISEWLAFAASGVSFVVAAIAVIWAIFVQRSDVAAGFAGATEGIDFVKNVFR